MSAAIPFRRDLRVVAELPRDAIMRRCRFAARHIGCTPVQIEATARYGAELYDKGTHPSAVVQAAGSYAKRFLHPVERA